MSARSEGMAEAAAIAERVAQDLTIQAQILDVEAAQARRSGEFEVARSLSARATWRADEAAGAHRAAHVVGVRAIDAYWADEAVR